MEEPNEKGMVGPHKASDIFWYFSLKQVGRCRTCGLEGSRFQLEEAISCPTVYKIIHERDRAHSVEL